MLYTWDNNPYFVKCLVFVSSYLLFHKFRLDPTLRMSPSFFHSSFISFKIGTFQ